MIQNYKNKVAVVTGGAGGIGMAMARRFLDEGMRVAIADISQTTLDAAVAELDGGDRLLAVCCDISNQEGNQTLAQQVEDRFGGANLVCLNAGIGRLKPLPEVSFEEWRLQVGVNLDGPFLGIKAFLPLLEREAEAHIVITASVMSLFASPVMGPYYATKAGILSFAESLYFDLQDMESNIGVSALMPGDTRTNVVMNNITEDTDPEVAAAAAAELEAATPPSVIADAVIEAVQENRFYVLPNPGNYWKIIDARYQRIREGRNPEVDYATV